MSNPESNRIQMLLSEEYKKDVQVIGNPRSGESAAPMLTIDQINKMIQNAETNLTEPNAGKIEYDK